MKIVWGCLLKDGELNKWSKEMRKKGINKVECYV
jgi:hypothetical protein